MPIVAIVDHCEANRFQRGQRIAASSEQCCSRKLICGPAGLFEPGKSLGSDCPFVVGYDDARGMADGPDPSVELIVLGDRQELYGTSSPSD